MCCFVFLFVLILFLVCEGWLIVEGFVDFDVFFVL